MAKTYKGQTFTLGLDPQTTKPLDVRMVIDTAADRLVPDTWKIGANYYVYPGMFTVCKDNGDIYVYVGEPNKNTDIINVNKWIKAGKDDGTANYVTMSQLNGILSSYVTNSALTGKLDSYLSKSDFEIFRNEVNQVFAKITDLPVVDTRLSDESDNPIANSTVTAELTKQAGDIDALSNIVNGLISEGIGEVTDYAIILKEESEVENLTAETTVEGVLYFGLEPLSDDVAGEVELDGNTVTVSNAEYQDNTVSVPGAEYENNTVTI